MGVDERLQQPAHALFDPGVVQGDLLVLQPESQRHAFVAARGGLRRIAPYVEQSDVLDNAKSSIRFNGLGKGVQ